jgi:DNA-binding MarR family transcriptional regulator
VAAVKSPPTKSPLTKSPPAKPPFERSPRWLQDLYPGEEGYTELLMGAWQSQFAQQQPWVVPVFAHANYLTKLIENLHTEVLKPLALDYSQYSVLITLHLIVGPEGATPKALNRVLLQTSAGMTKLLARLDNAGLIERLPNPADKRSIVVRLSGQGQQTAEQASALVATELYGKLASLGEADAKQLLQVLDQLVKDVSAVRGV